MSFTAPTIDYAALSPVIALTAGIVAVLVGAVFSGRHQRTVVSVISLATLAARRLACASGSGPAGRRTSWRGRFASMASGSRRR